MRRIEAAKQMGGIHVGIHTCGFSCQHGQAELVEPVLMPRYDEQLTRPPT